jgi:hypothetical protein
MSMDRLTARTKNGHAYLVNVKPDEQEVDSPHKNTLQCILDCFERLAQYEDAEEQGRCVVLPPVKGADIGNPLEPLKVYAALKSEILKYDYRAEHEPQKISALDYTIIMALQDVLTRAEAEKALGKEQA